MLVGAEGGGESAAHATSGAEAVSRSRRKRNAGAKARQHRSPPVLAAHFGPALTWCRALARVARTRQKGREFTTPPPTFSTLPYICCGIRPANDDGMNVFTVVRATLAVTFLSVLATGCAAESSNEDQSSSSTNGAIEEEQGVDVASSEAAFSSSGCRVSVPKPTDHHGYSGEIESDFSASCSRTQRLRWQICLQKYHLTGYQTERCGRAYTTVDTDTGDWWSFLGNDNGTYRTRVNLNGSYYYGAGVYLDP